MTADVLVYGLWAVLLGAVSAVSLPLGSVVGLRWRFSPARIAAFAAFGAGALIAALSVELVAPTALALAAPGAHATDHALADFVALIGGGALGGALFVALDAVVNQQGGYVRKTSTTLAHLAARRRRELREAMAGVLAAPPFDALPGDLVPVLAGMLRPVAFREGDTVATGTSELADAYIVLEGELAIEIAGRHGATMGPGHFVGVLALFVPELARVATVTAATDAKCLALARRDADQLRTLSPAFDQACRALAEERLGLLEHHLTTRLEEVVAWARLAAGALHRGTEMPALVLARAHGEAHGAPLAVWLGILLDGIPESIVIGAGLYAVLASHPDAASLRFVEVVPYTLVAGLFLSNFPEALSSSANMARLGWSRARIFWMWFALMAMTSVGAGLGFLLATVLAETWLVFAEGVAAGAMLTMIAAAMIPEAAAHGRPSAVGLSTLAGFLAAVLFKLLG